jgi:hypothetical protein
MTPFQREVRAKVYETFRDGSAEVTPDVLAERGGWTRDAVEHALARLEADHRIVLKPDGSVWMAHPFSGVDSGYRARIGDQFWNANCAWDALAILALLGDGRAEGPDGLIWEVHDGQVHPEGLIHLVVPVSRFWDDIGFT